MRYDAIVVGAGASGAVLAARLSEDPDRTVLLIEAGPTTGEAAPEFTDAGTLRGAHPDHEHNWVYPAHLTPDQPHVVVRGRILGGSTSINAGYFVRATPEDFARWAAGGNDEWTLEKSLPFYEKLETDHDFPGWPGHGAHGPMPVSRPTQDHPVTSAFAAASHRLGFPYEADKNAGRVPGWGPLPMNVMGRMRWDTGRAYIAPARHRPNLTVLGGAMVTRVVIERGRATGVQFATGEVVSGGEILLSAGSIGSAHLLMLSGIGAPALLERHDIPVTAPLAGVGAGFSDHPQVVVSWHPSRELPSASPMAGVLNTADHAEVLPLLTPIPDLLSGEPGAERALAVLVALQAADSRGTIRLQSADPNVPPTLDYRYLESDADQTRMRHAVRLTAEILASEEFATLSGDPLEVPEDDAGLDRWIRSRLGTANHLSGTAAFGDDPLSVVDQFGRVHGVAGLRVADTSILPVVPTRGPAATAVMIGERIADFIRRGD